jgi:hypothetical protein
MFDKIHYTFSRSIVILNNINSRYSLNPVKNTGFVIIA